MTNKLIFEYSSSGRKSAFFRLKSKAFSKPAEEFIPSHLLREGLPLPEVSELDVVRHYTNLSRRNWGVDTTFYPLGSCTMKYNPKVNEDIADNPYFKNLHPYQDEDFLQGALAVIYHLEKLLCFLTGMARFSFQPAAGAHGELIGMFIIKSFHKKNRAKRRKVIIPDSAHGTNPATAHMCGYEVVTLKSREDGLVDIEELKNTVDEDTAAMMLTNPNTLGLFEEDILKVSEILHSRGALLYYDGANFNPLLCIAEPSSMGFDVIHLNLHKTFATPHGSGGPGAGCVGVVPSLIEFLPVPLVDKKGDKFYFNYKLKHSIGKIKAFYGNFSVLLRAYAYILRLGKEGLIRVAENAVLNANYIRARLKDYYEPASPRRCMHEVVFSCRKAKEQGITALDIAKRLIDFGIHPPTMYFPLIVKEALMIEPTETESKETLDNFIEAMISIHREIEDEPYKLKQAPFSAYVSRVDEVTAARDPDLRWQGSGV